MSRRHPEDQSLETRAARRVGRKVGFFTHAFVFVVVNVALFAVPPIAIVPILKTPEDGMHAAKLYNELLRLNHVLMFAKFSIDDDLDIVLSVEYPLGQLDPSEVTDALAALGHYADQHFTALTQILA